MAKTFSPPMIDVVAADTDVSLLDVPVEKSFMAKGLRISNQNAAVARVRIWDTFTDSAGVVHTSIANEVKKWDAELQPGETAVIDDGEGIFDAIGLLVVQSSVGAAAPNHVSFGISGQFTS